MGTGNCFDLGRSKEGGGFKLPLWSLAFNFGKTKSLKKPKFSVNQKDQHCTLYPLCKHGQLYLNICLLYVCNAAPNYHYVIISFYVTILPTGWDFYRHPGILDDTKSSYITQNFWWNYRTLLRKLNIQVLKNPPPKLVPLYYGRGYS